MHIERKGDYICCTLDNTIHPCVYRFVRLKYDSVVIALKRVLEFLICQINSSNNEVKIASTQIIAIPYWNWRKWPNCTWAPNHSNHQSLTFSHSARVDACAIPFRMISKFNPKHKSNLCICSNCRSFHSGMILCNPSKICHDNSHFAISFSIPGKFCVTMTTILFFFFFKLNFFHSKSHQFVRWNFDPCTPTDKKWNPNADGEKENAFALISQNVNSREKCSTSNETGFIIDYERENNGGSRCGTIFWFHFISIYFLRRPFPSLSLSRTLFSVFFFCALPLNNHFIIFCTHAKLIGKVLP